jgi:predicted secreted protein
MMLSSLAKIAVVVIWGLGINSPNNFSILADRSSQTDDLVTTIVIYPDSIQLEQGDTFQFNAAALNQDGQRVEFSPIWITTGGEINQEGLYTATDAGCYEVLVTDAHTGVYAVAEVHIACHQESDACLVIDPGRVELSRGETIQFTAFGYSDSGGLVPIAVKWESGGGWIDENGNYTASDVGEFLITATQVGTRKFGTAHVSVKVISFLPPWMYIQSGKLWFVILGVLIGVCTGMGYYLYRRGHFSKPEEPEVKG